MSDSKELWLQVHGTIPDLRVTLGRASSNAYATDPKMIGFMAARYKIVEKMLEGCHTALEAGCGDGFGAPVVAQAVVLLCFTYIAESWPQVTACLFFFYLDVSLETFDFS